MTEEVETLVYLYGIVPADAPPPPESLTGLGGGSVRLEPVGDVAAIVGEVEGGIYGDEELNARLGDLGWVGEQGLAHERVLDWYAQRGPVIPLSLFSLHRDVARVRERVEAEASFGALLERLRGRREWGVKLWRRDAEAREAIDRISPALERLASEIESAPPGKRFLLERKREALRMDELRRVSSRMAHELYGALRQVAVTGLAMPLPSAAGAPRTLLLDSAFLVSDAEFTTFHQALGEQAKRIAGSGLEIEFTGPWPPYHFTRLDDE